MPKMSRYSFKSEGRINGGKKLQRKLRQSKELERKRVSGIVNEYKNPAYKQKLSMAQHARFEKLAEKQKISKALKKFWTLVERKEASLRMKKVYMERPEIREKIDIGMTSWWQGHGNVKIVYAIRATLQLLSDPLHYKKFLKGGKNPEERAISTLYGFLARSFGEKEIAEFLYFKKIIAEYETITLYLEGWICTPDFWLPKYKIFIEFYGGFPGSRRKKIIKNKLYRKYGIPCIFITPSELRNLDYYLLAEMQRIMKTKAYKEFKLSKFLKPRLSKPELKRFLFLISNRNIVLPAKTLEYVDKLKRKYNIA